MPEPASHSNALRGWILYDADCKLCTRIVFGFATIFHRYGFQEEALQADWVKQRLGLDKPEDLTVLLSEMRLLSTDGKAYGGVDAILEIMNTIWWLKPLVCFSYLPGMKMLLRYGYRQFAKNRHCSIKRQGKNCP